MSQAARAERRPSAIPGFLIATVFLTLVWLGFSEKRDAFHLAAGVGASALVAALCHRLLVLGLRRGRGGRLAIHYVFSFRWHRLIIFLPWLFKEILVANVEVAWLILHPRMPIDPAVIRTKTGMRSDLALMVLATVITVTPGTCVLDIEGDELLVHSIRGRPIPQHWIDRVRATFEIAEEEDLV